MPYDQNKTSNFDKQTLTEMADYADRAYHRVAAMVNADFWDIKTMDIQAALSIATAVSSRARSYSRNRFRSRL